MALIPNKPENEQPAGTQQPGLADSFGLDSNALDTGTFDVNDEQQRYSDSGRQIPRLDEPEAEADKEKDGEIKEDQPNKGQNPKDQSQKVPEDPAKAANAAPARNLDYDPPMQGAPSIDSTIPKKDDAKDKQKANTEEEHDEKERGIRHRLRNLFGRNKSKVAGKSTKKVGLSLLRLAIPALLPFIAIILIGFVIAIAVWYALGTGISSESTKTTQATALAYAGDVFSRRELDAKDIPEIVTAAQETKIQAQAKNDTESVKICDQILAKIQPYSSADTKVDQTILNDVNVLLKQLAVKGYGGAQASELGKKIAELAYYYASDPKGRQEYQTCSVDNKTACNQFVIKIMHDTKADPKYNGLAIQQYQYTKSRTDCYQQFQIKSMSQLAPGDILHRPDVNSYGIGHVAIYIGNGQIAQASLRTKRSTGHEPRIGSYRKSSGTLSVAARLKDGKPCPAS